MAETHPRVRLVTAAAYLRSACLFNLLSVSTTLLSAPPCLPRHLPVDKKMALLPLVMSLPPVMI